MSKLRLATLGVVVAVLQAGPALAQCSDPAGCSNAVPGPELGAGALGMAVAYGMVRFFRGRVKRRP